VSPAKPRVGILLRALDPAQSLAADDTRNSYLCYAELEMLSVLDATGGESHTKLTFQGLAAVRISFGLYFHHISIYL
jgi:hypothetical protein